MTAAFPLNPSKPIEPLRPGRSPGLRSAVRAWSPGRRAGLLRNRGGNRLPTRCRPSGAIAFELLLAVPVLLICVLAVTQFGVFFANLQILSLACRAGAEAASESALPDAGGVPADVLAAIDQQLLSSGIQRCRVRVEHNVGGIPTVLLTGVCACEPHTNLPAPLPPGRYVRVSVCVPMSELTPNLLASFGFDVSCYTASCTTVMRYEL